MKLTLLSDVHLEFGNYKVENSSNSKVLALCGDICVAKHLYTSEKQLYSRFDKFFETCSEKFEHVLYVLGNHEYYGGKWHQTFNIINNYVKKFKNIHVLEGSEYVLDDVTFIGGTLWTDFNGRDPYTMMVIRDLINDFMCISDETRDYRKITAETVLVKHEKTLARFKELAKAHNKVVVLSHHLPTQKSVPDEYVSQRVVNGAYYTELSDFILTNPQIKLWLHGHTHKSCDYQVGSCRVVCNPRGYIGYEPQASFYNPCILEV